MATIVITGASDGIGAAAAAALCPDHEVVIVGRNPVKTSDVARRLGVEHHLCDFASLDAVRRLADTLGTAHPRIDVLANNAGAMTWRRRVVTGDGFEATFQVNHLAGYLLTRLLLPSLRAGEGTVVMTSSRAARSGRIDLTDPSMARGWSGFGAYASSKLANLCTARGLLRHVDGVSAVSFHPGVVASSFLAGGPRAVRWLSLETPARRLLLTCEQGADTLVWLARGRAGVDWRPGACYARRRETGQPEPARDDAVVDQLWHASALLVGLA